MKHSQTIYGGLSSSQSQKTIHTHSQTERGILGFKNAIQVRPSHHIQRHAPCTLEQSPAGSVTGHSVLKKPPLTEALLSLYQHPCIRRWPQAAHQRACMRAYVSRHPTPRGEPPFQGAFSKERRTCNKSPQQWPKMAGKALDPCSV